MLTLDQIEVILVILVILLTELAVIVCALAAPSPRHRDDGWPTIRGGRQAGPAAAPRLLPVLPPTTPIPAAPDAIPTIVIDTPPGVGRGVLPVPPGIPIERVYRCSFCRDGTDGLVRALGACLWCQPSSAVTP